MGRLQANVPPPYGEEHLEIPTEYEPHHEEYHYEQSADHTAEDGSSQSNAAHYNADPHEQNHPQAPQENSSQPTQPQPQAQSQPFQPARPPPQPQAQSQPFQPARPPPVQPKQYQSPSPQENLAYANQPMSYPPPGQQPDPAYANQAPRQYPPQSPQANPPYSNQAAQYPPQIPQMKPAYPSQPAQYPPRSPQKGPMHPTQPAQYPPPSPQKSPTYPSQPTQYPPQSPQHSPMYPNQPSKYQTESPQGQYPGAQMGSPVGQTPPAQYPPQPVQFPPADGGPAGYGAVPPSPQKPTVQVNGPAQGIPVQGQYPSVGTEGWETGLFDCMEDPTNALITACFPCVTFGQIAEILDNGHTSCGTSGLLYCLIGTFIYVPCIFSCGYRTKLRAKYGLIESPAPDWITHCLCEWCALAQEYRELRLRGLDPAIGWMGNVNRNQQQGTMVPPVNQTMNM